MRCTMLGFVIICRCDELAELWDEEAERYADGHLELVELRANGWERVGRCASSGRLFLLDYVNGSSHGGGNARLRPIADAGYE